MPDKDNEDEGGYDFNAPLAVAAVFVLIVVTIIDIRAERHHTNDSRNNIQLVRDGH